MKSNTLAFRLRATSPSLDRWVYPLYPESVSIRWSKHDGDEFYLPDWNTELTFTRQDAQTILSYSLGTEFLLDVSEIDSNGDSIELITLKFKRIDGKFNDKEKTFAVTPKPVTPYDKILAHLDDEVDLFQLGTSPAIERVQMFARPIVQLFIEGGSTVGNWMGALHWETPVENWEDLYFGVVESSVPDPNNVLSPTLYGFVYDTYLSRNVFKVEPMGGATPNPNPFGVANTYVANAIGTPNDLTGEYAMDNGFSMLIRFSSGYYYMSIMKNGTDYWSGSIATAGLGETFSVVLSAVGGSTPSSMIAYFSQLKVATRIIANKHPITDSFGNIWGTLGPGDTGVGSFWGKLKSVDPFISGQANIVVDADPFIDATNYRYFIQYAVPADFAIISGAKTLTPNSSGLWQPNIYYEPQPRYKPFAPGSWGDWSVWYAANGSDVGIDSDGMVPYWLKHAYPLWSVLQVLLQYVDSNIIFDPDDFSGFFAPSNNPLYEDPVARQLQNVFLTPASNILVGNYDQPAQRAKITLGKLLDALKKVFLAYWHIDSNGKFKLEHKSYFENGGSYSGSPVVGLDLTAYEQVLLSKAWSFGQDECEFEADKLWSKIEYSWPENASDLFVGHPIYMLSDFVDPDESDERRVDGIMTDVDIMLTAPGNYSKDGFVMLSADYEPNKLFYYLPIWALTDGYDGLTYRLQNGRLSSAWLNYCYRSYGLPCSSANVENILVTANSTARDKVQTATWPALPTQFFDTANQLKKLIKTSAGLGEIEEFSLFLHSRKVESRLRFQIEP